jgi:hypothetical protein
MKPSTLTGKARRSGDVQAMEQEIASLTNQIELILKPQVQKLKTQRRTLRTQLKQQVERNVQLEQAEQFYIGRLNEFEKQMEQAKQAFSFDYEQLLRKSRKEAKVRNSSLTVFIAL